MEVLSALWVLLCLSFCTLFLSLAWSVHYVITRTHIPPGICQPRKMQFITICMLLGRRLAVLLEKLGICHRYKTWRFFFKGIPPRKSSELVIKDLLFNGVTVRVYWPQTLPSGDTRGMVFVPGGFGMSGGIQAYERMCRFIARESNTVVVSVGFRLAPEHPYPTQILDCYTATVHFLKNAKEYKVDPNRVTIGGDSSGATFAAVVCQKLATVRDLPRPRAQILLYPYCQMLDFNLPSYQQNQSVPLLFKKRSVKLGVRYLTGTKGNVEGVMRNAHVPEELRVKYQKWVCADHIPDEFKARGYVPVEPAPFSKELYGLMEEGLKPESSPLLAEDEVIRQLPETFLLTCEYDVLRDDGLLYKKRLQDNHVAVTWHHLKDGFHGIMSGIDCGALEFSNARSNLQHVVRFLERL
ncbi:arylacetamide deacetylase-like 4 [Sceloporus undulatus]|uniref:arylacetamide deacetylase-like 4 n=1 Tax=Sceloporus undulatus TaxID=8520 RepID=UPI001C4B4F1C|nr:arylacetamide deacetylase-like 4 [Sceloporus undulatus]